MKSVTIASSSLSHFTFSCFRVRLRTREVVHLPPVNKGNTLRGAFGLCFKRLVCFSPGECRQRCRHAEVCPYGAIFEPSPPADSERLRANQDIPRPFVIRPPLGRETRFVEGSEIEFELVLFGRVAEFFPYFAITFKALGEEGLGNPRGRVELENVLALKIPAPDQEEIYSSRDNLFRSLNWRTGPEDLLADGFAAAPSRVTLEFLTPTMIKSDARVVTEPQFHHIFKRLRDRINALSSFYCEAPLDLDFRQLGEASERIRTVNADIRWEDRYRRSWRTGQRHPMGGFTGRITFEGDLTPFWPFLVLGQYTHVGKYAVWGNGWYRVTIERSSTAIVREEDWT